MGAPEHQPGEFSSTDPYPRAAESIRPEEWLQFFAVAGWRVWRRDIWASEPPGETATAAAPEAKPLTIVSSPFDTGRAARLYGELQRQSNIPLLFSSGCTDLPSYILEPLSEDQVKTIDEHEKLTGHRSRLLRRSDLINVFGTPC